MPKKIKNKKDIFDKMFIISSVMGFVLLFFLIRNFNFDFLNYDLNTIDSETKDNIIEKINEYAVAGENKTKDPFITKNTELEDDFLLKPIVDESDPSIGPKDAKIIIVEFSDLTCEFCKKQESAVRNVMNKYKDSVRLVWKYYPNSFGPSLRVSAAAHCAYQQDKFWEFQDLFFEKDSDDINDELFLELADELELDIKEFDDCISSEKSFDMIMKDIKEANALRISGVPFFFIGDQEILGEINESDLERIIEIELNK